jgi:hypothetical protein
MFSSPEMSDSSRGLPAVAETIAGMIEFCRWAMERGKPSGISFDQACGPLILNGFTIVGLFLCLLRLVLGGIVVSVGLSAWRISRTVPDSSTRVLVENQAYSLILCSGVLIGLNVLSWPVLYLLLQSYVDEWPSVMCIQGVSQIGSGTLGASRYLPGLLLVLEAGKPLLCFVGGAAFLFYRVNRRTRTSPLLPAVVTLFLLSGVLGVADAAVEGSYLLIPKSEVRLSGGCCTTPLEYVRQEAGYFSTSGAGESWHALLIAAYFSVQLALIGLLLARLARPSNRHERLVTSEVAVLAVVSIPMSTLFFVEIASPAILGLPFHRCPYDLVSVAPESLVSVPLFLMGCFSVGWGFLLERFAFNQQTSSFLREFVAKLLFLGLFGFAGSTTLISWEWYLG